ncbi:hypothetical protein BGW41_003736 [Actinomortierella wolfii]|nr:hypothetical protein BGW41_003736 [Actinomortierella wolfii]
MNNTTPPIHKESMVHAKARPGNAPVQFPTTYHTASLLPAQHHQLPSDESKMDEDLSHSKASCVTQIADGTVSQDSRDSPMSTTGACRSNSNSSDSSTEYSGMYLHESGTTSTSSNTSYELGSSSSPHRHKRYTVRTSASCVNSALSDWSSSSSSETSTQQMIVIPSSSRSTETDATKGGSGHVPLHPNNQMASPAQQRDSLSQHPWRQYQEHVTANKTFRTDSGWSSQPGQDLAPPSRLQSVISSSAHMQTPVHAHSPQLLGSDSRASTAASNDTAPSASEPSNSGQDVLDPNGEDPAIRRAEQNRAAQRAFRLRKQKYIKWLEGKASELDEVYRIMAIVRAENQQLCNMVMELRGQVQQLYGELNPGMAAPNFLASGSGGTASTMIGHGIEVTRVGDHYESTLGREISMRLMNLGSFKNGGSEGRPRYQPRSSSSGSSSKRKSSTKTDQTWHAE